MTAEALNQTPVGPVGKARSRTVGVAQQIPRNSLALLMIAQVAVLVPLVTHISPWVTVVCLVCGYWRTQVYRGRWDFPPAVVKALMVFGSFVGIALSGYRTLSLEAATSLLVLAFALKLVEMKNRRDAYLVIFLCYFLVATGFLFSQTIAVTAYEVFALAVVTAAMVGLNQLHSRIRPIRSLGIATSLILQALPLTIVIFMLFPRIGPLWSIPMPSSATTGLSDRLTPGDIASLSQSDELAFRVRFDTEVPRVADMYWRGLTYSEFAEGTWTVGEPINAAPESVQGSEISRYQIFLQPTHSNWLFSLDNPLSFSGGISKLGDYRLTNWQPILSVFRYNVESATDAPLGLELSPELRRRETGLPAEDNPRIRAWAQRLYARTGSPTAMIDALLTEVRTASFSYTLTPPQLSRSNSVDQFWFDTRRGFCTHYAGAMVFALRSVGIPARMIGGYQGGEINPVTGHVVVRQYQAHAWVEAWLDGRGWTRFDPTAAVAPARVEQGLSAALTSAERANLSIFAAARQGSGDFLGTLLNLADSAEYQWNLWVVGYDATVQSSVLEKVLGSITPARILTVFGVGCGISLLFVCISLFWPQKRKRQNPIEKLLNAYSRRLVRFGHGKEVGETPAAYIARLAAVAETDASELIADVQGLMYDPESSVSPLKTHAIRRELNKLQLKLAFRGAARAS